MTRVLVVDDSPAIRHLFRDWLSAAGYAVEVAAGGLEALARLRRRGDEPMVVLLDAMLPDLDGVAVLESIAAGPAAVGHSVVLMSAQLFGARHSDLAALSERLGVRCVAKPFTAPEALALVLAGEEDLRRPADDPVAPDTGGARPEAGQRRVTSARR